MESFKVRKFAPDILLFSNLGAVQLNNGYTIDDCKKAIEAINADSLILHLNPLQEALMENGNTNFSGLLQKIEMVCKKIEVPVIVKETGAGISAEDAAMFEAAGVAGIDVAGVGGTSWAAVEYYRATARQDVSSQRLGETFWDWGIPTAVSLVETVKSVNLPVIASGGIRNGIDVTKALALGASLASATYPFLGPATTGSEDVKKALQLMVEEVRNAMFLVGANSIQKLHNVPVVLTGKTAEWLKMRGFQPEVYARRKA
ncbi:alpha-hydroxy-acid oxidizing protein [Candidatus Bathyarchaeota archaeon]|nr:alpha-hydroxy-acid oxidizing protein [Candidatus Bathyarchaeota archaeon]